jgi:hypothetical protein
MYQYYPASVGSEKLHHRHYNTVALLQLPQP